MSTWIPTSERLPTREDADERGEVAWKWADGTTCTGRFEDGGEEQDPAVAWLPLPPYTPPKPGPTDSDIIERLHAATSSEPTADEALRGPWLYAEAAADITRLRDERDALAKDATRYRWLSGRSAQSESPRWARWEIRRWTGRVWDTLDADGCDVEVDSAMEADAAMAWKP